MRLPAQLTLAEVHAAVPKELREKNTLKGLLYVGRDVLCAFIVYKFGWFIDPFSQSLIRDDILSPTAVTALKWSLWAIYWYWQGIILAGWFSMAHEAGHGTISNYNWINAIVGFSLHTVRSWPLSRSHC